MKKTKCVFFFLCRYYWRNELAQKMGTSQHTISSLESGSFNAVVAKINRSFQKRLVVIMGLSKPRLD
jgi:transcriptional regulator with XRE-family HTH domain